MAQYFKIGKLVAAHGLGGELILKHSLGKKTSLKGLSVIFIEERKKSFLPWFIESARVKDVDEVYLKLENVSSRESSRKLVAKEVWLGESDFEKFSSKKSPFHLLGYSIVHDKNKVGEILEVIEQPHQWLCRLEVAGKEVFIPLNESTLQKIDHKKKEVLVMLPDGLLDVYIT